MVTLLYFIFYIAKIRDRDKQSALFIHMKIKSHGTFACSRTRDLLNRCSVEKVKSCGNFICEHYFLTLKIWLIQLFFVTLQPKSEYREKYEY
jgi:hypothetical protein